MGEAHYDMAKADHKSEARYESDEAPIVFKRATELVDKDVRAEQKPDASRAKQKPDATRAKQKPDATRAEQKPDATRAKQKPDATRSAQMAQMPKPKPPSIRNLDFD